MPQDLEFLLINKWDDTVLEPGGIGKPVTKVRYNLGRYGPFEVQIARGGDIAEIEKKVRDKRAEIERLNRV